MIYTVQFYKTQAEIWREKPKAIKQTLSTNEFCLLPLPTTTTQKLAPTGRPKKLRRGVKGGCVGVCACKVETGLTRFQVSIGRHSLSQLLRIQWCR